MKTESFVETSAEVQAVQINAENAEEVAEWCSGQFIDRRKNGSGIDFYIRLFALPLPHSTQAFVRNAFVGDWIVRQKDGTHLVRPNAAFIESYRKRHPTDNDKFETIAGLIAKSLVDQGIMGYLSPMTLKQIAENTTRRIMGEVTK